MNELYCMGGSYMRATFFTVKKRLIISLIIGLSLFFIISIRLGYVQFILGDFLTKRAEDSWSRNVPFEPKRGDIVDRNDVKLATNQSAPTIFVVPRQIENPTVVAKQLAEVLGMPVQKAYKDITKVTSIVRLQEGRKVTIELASKVRDPDIKGVYIAEDSRRYYPFGKYLSHVLGFAGIDNQGLMGLEAYYDEELKGEEGNVRFFSDAKGKRMPKIADQYQAPIDGLDLRLTIDSRIQTAIERELDNAEAVYNPEGIIAIAMNPNNGEILGMSSRPSFNPIEYQSVSPIIYNRNLPVWSNYEPGSTFKIITLAASLEEKLVNLQKERFHDGGSIEVAGAHLHCWKSGGHGSQTFLEVVQNSCNPGFVELGNRLGKDRLFKYIKDFGFGEKTGIDLQGEGTGILFKPERVGPLEHATTSFGQGVSVTPIQQVAAVAAVVNGGYLYKPYIAKELVDPKTGKVLKKFTPELKRKIISEETSMQVRNALESVVAQGTGKNAFVEGLRVGGKTGTAQKVKDGRYMENNYIVSFIGFAPADKPEIVIYVAVDHPRDTLQFGGTVAAPIVGNIMKDVKQILDIKPRKGEIPKEYNSWLDPAPVVVPNFVGMDRGKLQTQLVELKIEASGVGEIVKFQSPAPGAKVKPNSKIRLYFDGVKPKEKQKQ
jgi:stage V sporulation protein D (sporulation-specific penicillin-binding protein)